MKKKHLKDLREYIAVLETIGEVQSIDKKVDLFLEVGAIIRRSYDLRAPAPLFKKLGFKDQPIGADFRVLGAPAGASCKPKLFLSRVAVSLGLTPDTTSQDIIKVFADLPKCTQIKPNIVSTGPCKENIMLGKDIRLTQLPAPQINQNDSGRYLNTWGTLVSQTPSGKWTNWGIARVMLLDDRRCIANVVPTQDTGKIRDMWSKLGNPMPIAIFQGGPPAIPFVSAMSIPFEINECDVIGGYIGYPLELVQCETINLQVPARAEIVVEGTMSLDETALEGPMGEFSGSICLASRNNNPVINVSAVTHRDKAILPVVASGYPIEENHTCWALGMSARIYTDLKEHGFPVTGCFIPFESAVHWLVVTVDCSYIWHKKNRGEYTISEMIDALKNVIFKIKPGIWMTKILLMADDIDPSNINDVVWAFATRCHPEQHLIYPDEDLPLPLVGFLSGEEKKQLKCTKVIYNCLYPGTWTREQIPIPVKFETTWPKSVQERVKESWGKYGYTVD